MHLGSVSSAQATADVTAIFQQYFGRTPAASGLAFWVNALTTGVATEDNVALKIVQSAQSSDKAYFVAHFPQLAAQIYGSGTVTGSATPDSSNAATSGTGVPAGGATQTVSASGSNDYLIYGALAVGAYLMFKKKGH
jgi:hypothetical protein